jgi:hypothetical protein
MTFLVLGILLPWLFPTIGEAIPAPGPVPDFQNSQSILLGREAQRRGLGFQGRHIRIGELDVRFMAASLQVNLKAGHEP